MLNRDFLQQRREQIVVSIQQLQEKVKKDLHKSFPDDSALAGNDEVIQELHKICDNQVTSSSLAAFFEAVHILKDLRPDHESSKRIFTYLDNGLKRIHSHYAYLALIEQIGKLQNKVQRLLEPSYSAAFFVSENSILHTLASKLLQSEVDYLQFFHLIDEFCQHNPLLAENIAADIDDIKSASELVVRQLNYASFTPRYKLFRHLQANAEERAYVNTNILAGRAIEEEEWVLLPTDYKRVGQNNLVATLHTNQKSALKKQLADPELDVEIAHVETRIAEQHEAVRAEYTDKAFAEIIQQVHYDIRKQFLAGKLQQNNMQHSLKTIITSALISKLLSDLFFEQKKILLGWYILVKELAFRAELHAEINKLCHSVLLGVNVSDYGPRDSYERNVEILKQLAEKQFKFVESPAARLGNQFIPTSDLAYFVRDEVQKILLVGDYVDQLMKGESTQFIDPNIAKLVIASHAFTTNLCVDQQLVAECHLPSVYPQQTLAERQSNTKLIKSMALFSVFAIAATLAAVAYVMFAHIALPLTVLALLPPAASSLGGLFGYGVDQATDKCMPTKAKSAHGSYALIKKDLLANPPAPPSRKSSLSRMPAAADGELAKGIAGTGFGMADVSLRHRKVANADMNLPRLNSL